MPNYLISDLEVFASIVRNGSFRGAATERGVSPASISQTMRHLEESLGVRLLNRTTRSIGPTEVGERLLRRLGPALNEISEAVDEVNEFRHSPSGSIRINAPAPAIEHVLAPMLDEFLSIYPDITIELISDAAIVDIVEKGFDAGVRFGEELDQDMIAIPLGPRLRYAVVAAPDYLARAGTPRHPKDLLEHDCIRHRFPGGSIHAWDFERNGESFSVNPHGRLTLSCAHHQVRLVKEGHGIAHVFDSYVADAIRAGELVEILKEWSPSLPSWYLYYPSRRHVPAAMKAFTQFVLRDRRQSSAEGAVSDRVASGNV